MNEKSIKKLLKPLVLKDFLISKHQPPSCFSTKQEDNFLLKAMQKYQEKREAKNSKDKLDRLKDYFYFIVKSSLSITSLDSWLIRKRKKFLLKACRNTDILNYLAFLVIAKSFKAFNIYNNIKPSHNELINIYQLCKHYNAVPIDMLGVEYTSLDAYSFNRLVLSVGMKYENNKKVKL